MKKKTIFQDSFLVSGIMCHQDCGTTLQNSLKSCFQDFQTRQLVAGDAEFIVDAEPQRLGIHKVIVTVEQKNNYLSASLALQTNETEPHLSQQLSQGFKDSVEAVGFEVVKSESNKKSKLSANWLNLLVNALSLSAILLLSLLCPPSLPLTIGLAALSTLTTGFTARQYLLNFAKGLKTKKLFTMNTTVTFGWCLSFIHTVYHSALMPLANFSMVFMSFIMPAILMLLINGMDELKRLVSRQSAKVHLQSINDLFPQMTENYHYHELSLDEQKRLEHLIIRGKAAPFAEYLKQVTRWNLGKKNVIKKGMVLSILPGECFPVDCQLIDEQTIVDASLLTGEVKQKKAFLDFIPAGAVNLGQTVRVHVLRNSYNSTINQILFRSNRAKPPMQDDKKSNFISVYAAVVVLSIIVSIAIPAILGLLTLPLLLQNGIGILFGICPCTIAIAHELPHLLSVYQLGKKGVVVREETLLQDDKDMHTVVFDKTGTLTTGKSKVCLAHGISACVLERIYLLEKHAGGEHPLAKAICHYFETKTQGLSMLRQVERVAPDSRGRGLSALVQGRQMHIGSAEYLENCGIEIKSANKRLMQKGYSLVYVAQDRIYQGFIAINHEARPQLIAALGRLKNKGMHIIMLTGDALLSAKGFNKQNGHLFAEEDIFAGQSPEDKELFMKALLTKKKANAHGVWFVGDGLNDAACARLVSEKGGVSCAMTADTKAAFFTDVSLNGSLDYLFAHKSLNQLRKKHRLQNKGLLVFSMLTYLAFISCFSAIGLALSPVIPLAIMVATTLLTLFNSYRLPVAIDQTLEKKSSLYKRFLASDASLGLIIGACFLLTCALLISSVATGGLTLPIICFTAGAAMATSSACFIGAAALATAFLSLSIPYFFKGKQNNIEPVVELKTESNQDKIVRPTRIVERTKSPSVLTRKVLNDQSVDSNSEISIANQFSIC